MIFEKKNFQTVQRLNKFFIELTIFLYTQKIAIIFDYSRLGPENKFFLNKITHSPTYDHLYFIRLIGQPRNIILCYKGRLQDTIVLSGSQFTRCSFLACISFSKREAESKKIRLECLCSTSVFKKILPTNLVACKPAFNTFYTSHLRYTVLIKLLYRPQTDFALFCPI